MTGCQDRSAATLPRHVRAFRSAAFVFLALMIVSCGHPPPIDPDRPYTTSEAERVFETGFASMRNYHIRPPPLGEMVLRGLNGLATLDKGIGFELRRGPSLALITGDGRMHRFPAPAANNAAGWSRLAVGAIDTVRRISPTIGSAQAERIYEVVFDAALAGLDRHTRYLSATEARSSRADREGYSGIGLRIDRNAQAVRVRDVFEDGPAWRAGVREGDAILAINGIPVAGWPIERIVERIRGPRGEEVRLLISRAGSSFEVSAKRGDITVQTVFAERAGAIRVIRITGFNENTSAAVERVLESLAGSRVEGLVVDLRGNRGGVLDEAVAVADMFLEQGTILTTQGRHPEARQLFVARPASSDFTRRLVVLIDRASASAAEVLAAALRDNRRAVLIGGRSHGKGTVQRLRELPNTGQLNITWARMHSPAGYTLAGRGVRPAVCTGDLGTAAGHALERLRRQPATGAPPESRCAAKGDDGREFELDLARQILDEPELFRRLLAGGAATGS